MTSNSRIVLITGANTVSPLPPKRSTKLTYFKGLGYGIAKHLTSQHKEYHVLIGSRSLSRGEAAASELQKEGLSVEAIQIDVTDDTSIAAAASHVKEKFGHLDVLVNNAGIAAEENFSPSNPSRQVFQNVFNTNVFGAFAVTEAFTPLLNASPLSHPQVQFTSSIIGSLTLYHEKSAPHSSMLLPVYRSSKSALNMLTLYFRDIGKERGWEVNANCPGPIATNINNGVGLPMEVGVINAVNLIIEGGKTGTFSNKEGPLPW